MSQTINYFANMAILQGDSALYYDGLDGIFRRLDSAIPQLFSFANVAAANAMTLSQFQALQAGYNIYVETVDDYFTWYPNRTDTVTPTTILNPTINGVNPGRLIRQSRGRPRFMSQATWFVDEANSSGVANDENDGLTTLTPLLTDLERNRRMGFLAANWTLSEYHLRYISNAASGVMLLGQLSNPSANIFLHSSATNGQGNAVLPNGNLVATAVTVVNHATNTPLQITAAALPVSWTASGFVNARCRFTSGAGNNGVCWTMFDAGAKVAQMSEGQVSNNFVTPYAFGNGTFNPALNDTFVVESLSNISQLAVQLTTFGLFNTNAIILDSLKIGALVDNGLVQITFWGCDYAGNQRPGISKTLTFGGVRIEAGSFIAGYGIVLANSYADDSSNSVVTVQAIGSGSNLTRFITYQRNGFRMTGIYNPFTNSFSISVTSIGIFNNSAAAGLQMGQGWHFTATSEIWGVSGAGGAPLELTMGSRLDYAAAAPGAASYYYVNTAAAPATAWIQYRRGGAQQTSAPTFDTTTSAFTTYRALTAALIQTTIGGGGVNGAWFDPVSGCAMMPQ